MKQQTTNFKRKTHGKKTSNAFTSIFNQNDFADVTLVCEDQTQLTAHKVVLGACSPVLRDILLNNPHPHPLIYLSGIKQYEMQSILKFMYLGETAIAQDRIEYVKDVAKMFQVNDLEAICGEETKGVSNYDKLLNTYEYATNQGKINSIFNFNVDLNQVEQEENKENIQREYPCADCNEDFSSQTFLSRHRQTQHPVLGMIYKRSDIEKKNLRLPETVQEVK